MIFTVAESSLDILVEEEKIYAGVSDAHVPNACEVASPSCTIGKDWFVFCIHHHVDTCRILIDQERPIPDESVVFTLFT